MTPLILTFDVTLFRQQFPAFTSATTYPDAMLQMYWDMATCYISDVNCGNLNGSCRQLAINAMTAHFTQISVIVGTNAKTSGIPKIVNSSTIDKITVSLTPPPFGNSEWRWWMETTPYGQQALALLEVKSVGGFTIGGLPETAAIRRVGGIFV